MLDIQILKIINYGAFLNIEIIKYNAFLKIENYRL